jgi:hypothetical protein
MNIASQLPSQSPLSSIGFVCSSCITSSTCIFKDYIKISNVTLIILNLKKYQQLPLTAHQIALLGASLSQNSSFTIQGRTLLFSGK